jgi:AcrR family transcriptional regulator
MDKRSFILNVAEREFAKRGFGSVGMRDIAKKVRLHSSTLYHYFPNKESLYFAVIERTFQSARELIEKALSREISSKDDLMDFIEAHFDFICKNENYFKIILHELTSGGPFLSRIAKGYIQPLIERLREIIVRFKERNLLRQIEPQHILLSILAVNVIHILFAPLIQEILKIDYPFPPEMMEERKKANLDLLLYGIFKANG